jgi:hypothetical protein
MNYEIESKLRDKADKWEVQNTQNEISHLKNEINDLQRSISRLESVNSNRYYVLDRLITLLTEHSQFEDISNQLNEIRCNL